MCRGGRGRTGRPEKQLLSARPAPGKRPWSVPAVRAAGLGQRLAAAGTLAPPRSPAAVGHGMAPLGMFWHNGAVREVGQREDGMKRRSQGSRGDTGIPACGKAPTYSVALAGAKATELGAVFQSLETRCSTCRAPGWRGTRTGRGRWHWECSPAPGQEPRPPSPRRVPSGTWHQLPGDAPHPSRASPGSSTPGPPREAHPALGAVCFCRDLPLQLEFIWGLMPGPSPRVTVNNPPPCSL